MTKILTHVRDCCMMKRKLNSVNTKSKEIPQHGFSDWNHHTAQTSSMDSNVSVHSFDLYLES